MHHLTPFNTKPPSPAWQPFLLLVIGLALGYLSARFVTGRVSHTVAAMQAEAAENLYQTGRSRAYFDRLVSEEKAELRRLNACLRENERIARERKDKKR